MTILIFGADEEIHKLWHSFCTTTRPLDYRIGCQGLFLDHYAFKELGRIVGSYLLVRYIALCLENFNTA